MTTRIEDRRNLQGAVGALLGLEGYVRDSGLETGLLDLVRLRVSQINGCAFCLSMHTRDLLKLGERIDRIAVLPAWRETDWFTDRERAALLADDFRNLPAPRPGILQTKLAKRSRVDARRIAVIGVLDEHAVVAERQGVDEAIPVALLDGRVHDNWMRLTMRPLEADHQP